MMPKGCWRAGCHRFRAVLIYTSLLLALAGPAAAESGPHPAPSNIPASITAIIDATKSAFGAAPEKPQYERTRFVVELAKAAQFEVFSLANPNRVVLEVANVPMRLPALPDAGKTSLITSLRSGLAGNGKVRLVIDVAQPVIIENAVLSHAGKGGEQHQLSLDIVPVAGRSPEATRVAVSAGRIGSLGVGTALQPPLPRPAETPKTLRERSFKPVVVIDPGHGGHDSGAKKFGIQEKDVVLAFSLVLREKLEESGRYRVLMTRETDEFVTLDGRREFADKHKAALFIAVHADYASSNASGATIYSLRDRVAMRLKRSAKREVAEDVLGKNERKALQAVGGGGGTLKRILTDLAMREVEVTQHRTDLFSQTVIERMGQSTDLRNQPHRSAAFRVIKTAKMPSVLIELAYVSNRRDARRLVSKAWREKVAGSIATAVDEYFTKSISRVPM